MVEVFHSLIGIGAVGVSWSQLMKGRVHPPPLTALSFPDLKKGTHLQLG